MESSPLPEARPDELSRELQSLREQHTTHLRVQLALVLAVGVFVWRSAQLQHRSLVEVRQISARIQQDVARQGVIVIELQKIAASRPEFAALLKKHGIGVPASASSAPSPRQ